ncbi:YycH family regulatory protein [Lederbergia citrea]|uniref:YycH family regulatory protein n=1 Tax=Lederbergia citrea TaxID=2833581 RepID=UPI001BC9DEE9|nr:hypothetical protein [Lederbergia citrea]
MNYEALKSIMLLLLVAASGILTWSLWTYQPKYEYDDKKYVHEISIADQVDAVSVIKPTRVLVHMDDSHFGTVNEKNIDKLINSISSWNFYDIGHARKYTNQQIHQLSHSKNRIEITYPDLVPFDLYKGVIHLETDNFPNAAFNRIVINLDNDTTEGSIYFISTKDEIVYESHVNPDRITALVAEIKRNKDKYDPYLPYKLPKSERIMFLPSESKELVRYKYYPFYIDPEKFKNALFSDPSKVRRVIKANGEKFTDDLSLMDVDYMTNMIFYINPGQKSGTVLKNTDNHVLKRSINFINEHGGWTDHYRYFNIGDFDQKTTFQLFMNGYPVFNENGITEIRLSWGNEEIYQYKRPYFSLDIPLPGQTKVRVPSGEIALNTLLEDAELNPELLQELMIGYKLGKDSTNPKVLVLEPSWYYLYAGSWLPLDVDDERRKFSGLE